MKAESRDEDDQYVLSFTIFVSSLNVAAKPKRMQIYNLWKIFMLTVHWGQKNPTNIWIMDRYIVVQ